VNRNDPSGKVDCWSWDLYVQNELGWADTDAGAYGNCGDSASETSVALDPCSVSPEALDGNPYGVSCDAAPPCYQAANSGGCDGGGSGGAAAPPPQGPGGGGGPQNRDLLDAAVAQALQDLLKLNCAQSVFGGGIAKGDDPATVLQDLENGTKYGSIKFAGMAPAFGAVEATSGFGPWKKATISINTFNDPSLGIYWNAGNTAVNAITLLHELGHAFNGLFGNGSSAIVYDANPDGTPNLAAENQNTQTLAPCN